ALFVFVFFFFFQAEDGIRDFHVTGVQTCALPILDDVVAVERDDADAEPVAERVTDGPELHQVPERRPVPQRAWPGPAGDLRPGDLGGDLGEVVLAVDVLRLHAVTYREVVAEMILIGEYAANAADADSGDS